MKKLIKSMSYAFIAQIVALLVSVFASFFVSRFMSIKGFGYYQLFLFYSTFAGLFQFGVSEGVYLESGGKRYEDIDRGETKQLFLNALILETIVLIAGVPAAATVVKDDNKKVILVLLALYAVTYLFVMYFGMLLQAVNKTEQYSKAIIVGKVVTLALYVALVLMKNYDYLWYCITYLFGYMISGATVVIMCKDIIKEKIVLRPVISARKSTFSAGFSLLLSGLVSTFILSINRIYIEHFMGIETFGKVSMALNLVSFFLMFAIQIGMVMFPSVVLLNDKDKKRLYKKLDLFSAMLTPLVLLGYIPLKLILSVWIPQYSESIRWMLLFIPYLNYEIKTQVMYNTYLKALRKEKYLFAVNLGAFIFCAVVNYILMIRNGSLEMIFWVIDATMIIKSFVLSRGIEKIYDINLMVEMVAEAVLCCLCTFFVYNYTKIGTITVAIVTFTVLYLAVSKLNARYNSDTVK